MWHLHQPSKVKYVRKKIEIKQTEMISVIIVMIK